MPDSQSRDCQITADAVVLATRSDGLVDLEFTPPAGCRGCAGTCLWKRLTAARLERLPVAGEVRTGDRVSVSLSGTRLLIASSLLYGVPLAAILAGAATGAAIGGTDFATLAGAVAAIAVVIIGFRFWRGGLERATLADLTITRA